MPDSHEQALNTVNDAGARLGINRLDSFYFSVAAIEKSAVRGKPAHLGAAIQDYLRSFEDSSPRKLKYPFKETLHLGKRKDGSQQTEAWLITHDPARIQQLKALGMARGTTPTSFVIGFMGDYMRALMSSLETEGMVTQDWQAKWAIVTQVQKAMRKLEAQELEIVPGDFKAQEALRQNIFGILDHALLNNEKLALTVASTNGRVNQSLYNARQFIWGYRFPNHAFTKADQLHFSFDKDNALIYQASMHMNGDPGIYPALRAFMKLRHYSAEKIKPALSVSHLSYWYHSLVNLFKSNQEYISDIITNKNFGLKRADTALKAAEIGGLEGFWLGIKGIAASLPGYMMSTFSLGGYFNREWLSFKENISNKLMPKVPEIKAPKPHEKITSAVGGQWVQSSHLYDPEVHYNFIARLARSFQTYLGSVESMLLQHPVAGTMALAASIVSCSATLAPAMFKNLVMQAGINKQGAESFITMLNKMMAIDNTSSTISKLDGSARLVMQANAVTQSIAQRDPTIAASRIMAISNSLGAVLGVGLLGHASVASTITDGDEYRRFHQDLNKLAAHIQRAVLSSPKEHPGFIGALFLQPFRLMMPPLRLLIVPFIALFVQGSREAFAFAMIKELKNTAHEFSRAALFVTNLILTTAFTVFNLSTTLVDVLHNTAFKFIYKPLGSIGSVTKAVGTLLQYGFQGLYHKAQNNPAYYLPLALLSPTALTGFILEKAGMTLRKTSLAIVKLKHFSENIGHVLVNFSAQFLFRTPIFLADRIYKKTAELLDVDLKKPEMPEMITKQSLGLNKDLANKHDGKHVGKHDGVHKPSHQLAHTTRVSPQSDPTVSPSKDLSQPPVIEDQSVISTDANKEKPGHKNDMLHSSKGASSTNSERNKKGNKKHPSHHPYHRPKGRK